MVDEKAGDGLAADLSSTGMDVEAAANTAAAPHSLRAEAPAFSPPKPVELDEPMDAEAPASPRREQQRMLMEASEALASKAQAVPHHRPPGSETRPIRQFRRPNT